MAAETLLYVDAWGRLYRLGAAQHNVVARWQAPKVGIPLSTFDQKMRREQWLALHVGLRLLPGGDPSNYCTRVSAALLATGGEALATAWTGLYLHGVIDRPPPLVIVVPWGRPRRRLRGVRLIRSRTLLEEDRDVVDALAVASIERSFVDTARTDPRGRLRTLLIDGRQRRIVELSSIALRAQIHPGIPGTGTLISAVRDVDAVGADSVLSDVVHRRLLADGLHPDPEPVPVSVPHGRTLHPDISFASRRVCVECDSRGFHGTQRGMDLDHRKDQGYRQAGWNSLRIGWYRIEHDWPGFVDDLRSALAAGSVVRVASLPDTTVRRHAVQDVAR